MTIYNETIGKYFGMIDKEVSRLYEVAGKARAKGYDPEDKVDIPLAKNMAERVEGLISIVAPQIVSTGVVERIQELEKRYGEQDWRVAMHIALEVAQQKFCKFKGVEEAMEVGIRVGFSYTTVGVVVSPLEGFVKLKLIKRNDGKEYFSLYYSGPIRSAGGTGASTSLLIADYVRKNMGYEVYDPTEKEIKRSFAELRDYHERVTNLQYYPSQEEAEYLTKHLPMQLNGDPTEKFEVSNYKDLPRVESNRIRGGYCLILAECIASKAPKVLKQLNKWGDEMGMEHWKWLTDFVTLQKDIRARSVQKKQDSDSEVKVKPDTNYIKDLVAGRPVITHPMAKGGFRLRYGRSRVSGFSSNAIHPATMEVLEKYIAIGTQLKMERPGKATVIASCDSVEGPIVKLNNGNVLRLENLEQAKEVVKEIDEVIFLGDMLINYGDFYDRAHKLITPGFCEEWWGLYLKKYLENNELDFDKEKLDLIIGNPINPFVTAEEAINISKKTKIPFHPRYTYHWRELNQDTFKRLCNWFYHAAIKEKNGKIEKIILPFTEQIKEDVKRDLELIGIPHKLVANEYVVLEKNEAQAIAYQLGFYDKKNNTYLLDIKVTTPLEIVNKLCEVEIKDKSGYFIGARMGRPEKAKMRKMKGDPHGLFPVGEEGGRMKSLQAALQKGKVYAELPLYHCKNCDRETIYKICELCNQPTTQLYYCWQCKNVSEQKCEEHGRVNTYQKRQIDIVHYYQDTLKRLKLDSIPQLIKGVKGLNSKAFIPEHMAKGILRARHNLFVNKEGTIRYDMTETVMTHFKPKEIGTSVEKLKELGYDKDIYGNNLVDENQVLELRCQDVVLPACKEAVEEGADEILFRVTKFIDELLVKLYSLNPYYNLKIKEELVGHLVMCLSPHTSAGATARIIGFTKTQGFYAHPLLHSLMRRDADGDEAGILLLLDALLNFSRQFLPNRRGVTQDAPLVLTSRLIPSEVDDMVFNMDIVDHYPLEFYEAAEQYKQPWDVKVGIFNNVLGTEKQYQGLMFTHDTDNINNGVKVSAYKFIPSMLEKVWGQMEIARKLRAVNKEDVARLIIDKHFLRDIKGNLRKYSQQQFRCSSCNEKYRRLPLTGKCVCGKKLIFTISEGSVIKYVDPCMQISERFNLPDYLNQTLKILKERIDSVFGKDLDKQEGLDKWF